MPRKKSVTDSSDNHNTTPRNSMDFGATAIANPVYGHGSSIDSRAAQWGGFKGDILEYLRDIKNLEQFANSAQDAEELSLRIDPFLENAEKMMTALGSISQGQVKFTELKSKYGNTVAEAIKAIRVANAQFDANMEAIDAQDKSAIAKIEQKRKHKLAEIGTQLSQDMAAELFRHNEAIKGITNRQSMQSERQAASSNLREQRQALMQRARHGSRALGEAPPEAIEVNLQEKNYGLDTLPSGTSRSWGGDLKNFWNNK